jgi:hypothetical protein
MKKILFILLSMSILLACNAPDKPLTEEQKLALKKQENDSLMVIFDSLMQVKINVAPLIDSNFISAECIGAFNTLAQETEGSVKVLATSKLVARTIMEIIRNNAKDNTDIMFMIDKTSSMEDDLGDIKKSLDQILLTIQKFKNIRLAVGTYGDRLEDGPLWYDFKNFESDFSETSKFINGIKMTHGGDYPESVYDGIYEAFQENFWRSDSKRMVILIGDAPSLDSAKTNHHLDEIISIAKKDKINMNFYPIVLSPAPGEFNLDDQPRMEKMNLITNLYPNPTSGPLAIKFHNHEGLTLELIDQKGQVLQSHEVTSSEEKLDLYEQPNGVYIIRVYDKYKNSDERKIIVNK